ncbi:UNKNOWN [Stylonychia lemnae]|uniref:Uncharacterized protein n=1 Tax=Stylonychia lemnae TaxID=5949 RepID=A0A078AV10_STYLE|nr:UNKNOWN [Stylonychia lemnae]|eukprot:CDW85836.1 UNKNOWN [Stylonychia lemnae]
MTSEENNNKSQNPSQLTSNVDSVYSFYGQNNGKLDASQSENLPDCEQPKKQKTAFDLKLLNDEINASILTSTTFSTKHQNLQKQKKKNENFVHGKSPMKPVEIQTFQQAKGQIKRGSLNKRSIEFQDPLAKKYNLSNQSAETTEMSNLAGMGNMSEPNSNSCFENINKNRINKKMFIMGADSRLQKLNGIYIDPNINLRKNATPKKKSSASGGKDIRYQMRQFEQASKLSADDFFFGGPSIPEEPAEQEEQVEDTITQKEVEQGQRLSLEEQARALMKKRKLNQDGNQEVRKYKQKDRTQQPAYKQVNVFIDSVENYPTFSWNEIMAFRNSKQSKLNIGYVQQLKMHLINGKATLKREGDFQMSQDGNKAMSQGDQKQNVDQINLEFKTLAIQKSHNVCSLIGFIQNREYVKVIVDPIKFKQKLEINQKIRLINCKIFDIYSHLKAEINQPFKSKKDYKKVFRVNKLIVPKEIKTDLEEQNEQITKIIDINQIIKLTQVISFPQRINKVSSVKKKIKKLIDEDQCESDTMDEDKKKSASKEVLQNKLNDNQLSQQEGDSLDEKIDEEVESPSLPLSQNDNQMNSPFKKDKTKNQHLNQKVEQFKQVSQTSLKQTIQNEDQEMLDEEDNEDQLEDLGNNEDSLDQENQQFEEQLDENDIDNENDEVEEMDLDN